MKKQQAIKKLKDCRTEKEVRELLNDLEISRTHSQFKDNIYLLPADSSNKIHKASIRLNNSILDLALRVFYFLKSEGHILYVPKNTGKLNHFTMLHTLLRDIENVSPEICSVSDIDESIIDSIIINMRNKDINPTAIMDKIKVLANTARSTAELPPFMQINISIFAESSEYMALEEEAREYNTILRDKIVGGKRDLKSIKLMLDLCKKAVNYFDKYMDDGLVAASMYASSKRDSPEKTYSALFEAFLSSEHTFVEPALKEISESIKKGKIKYEYLKTECNDKTLYENLGRSTPKLLYRVKSCFTRLESACIIITAITTAMRSGELFTLGRYPSVSKVEDGEYYLLEKTVYKTAGTEHGETKHIPIPEITKKALETLSKMGEFFELPKDGILFWGETGKTKVPEAQTLNALNKKIKRFGDFFKIPEIPTMHDFRHTMAFIIAYLNEREGIELVGMLLNHTSREMSVDYLGYFSEAFNEVMEEKYREGGKELIKNIGDGLRNGETLHGKQGEKIMDNYLEYQRFTGGVVDDFADIFEEGTSALLEKGHIGIIQTSMCVCVHDLTKPEKMACQKGFSLVSFTGTNPIPSRCQGVDCGSSIFREVDINSIKEPYIDEELKKRLSGNRIFRESGGFANEGTMRLLGKHNQKQERG